MVTMMSNVKLNQPSTMALVPTPDMTLPLPKSWAITEAATEAVCCHSTETRTKMEATKRATTMSSTSAVGTITRNDEVSEDPKSSQRQEKKVMVVLSRETTRET